MKALIPEPPLLVLPSLAKELGINEAIALQQLHYWTPKAKPDENGERWVFKTIREWREEFPWLSPRTIRRVMERLQEKGCVDIRQPAGNDRTNHYRVLYGSVPGFDEVSEDASRGQVDPMSNTTETTTERTTDSSSSPTSNERDQVQELWDYHESVFGPQPGKGLTPSRRRALDKAFKEFTLEELKRGVIGLKNWRESHPGSTELAAAFSTNPRSGPLVERIGFWIEQAGAAPEHDDLDPDTVRREQGLD